MKPTVIVTRKLLTPEPIERLAERASVRLWEEDRKIDRDALLDWIADADGVLSMLTDSIDTAVLDAGASLKVVSNMAVGVDNIDLVTCADRGVKVGHTPDVLTDTTADTAWMLLMAASRRMLEGIDTVREGRWGPWDPTELLAHDVSGTTLGVVGLGRIGLAIAKRSAGFGMDVRYTARSARPDAEAAGFRHVPLHELLSESDHVVVAVDLNDQTRGLIGAAEFAAMKPTANLVNVARGPVVDTDALVEALATGSIRCAGLDVTDPEPLPADHPLASLPNCLIIPHMGSSTWRTRTAMANIAVDNLIAGITDKPLPHQITVP